MNSLSPGRGSQETAANHGSFLRYRGANTTETKDQQAVWDDCCSELKKYKKTEVERLDSLAFSEHVFININTWQLSWPVNTTFAKARLQEIKAT